MEETFYAAIPWAWEDERVIYRYRGEEALVLQLLYIPRFLTSPDT